MQAQSRVLISLLFLAISIALRAQLFHGSADGATKTDYSISGKPDSIFIFTIENKNKFITAIAPDSGFATFDWYYFKPGSGYILFASESDTISKIDTITSDMSYMVKIKEGAKIDSFRCWVFIQDFSVTIISTVDRTISNNDIRCGYIKNIEAKKQDKKYVYYNPTNNQVLNYVPQYNILWKTDPPEAAKPIPSGGSLKVSVEDPYWKNTRYIISVTDKKTNLERRDTAFYISIQPHAFYGDTINNLVADYIELSNTLYYPYFIRDSVRYEDIYGTNYNALPDSKSAPAIFLFKNESENADGYTWLWGDSTKTQTNIKIDTTHLYKLPGSYDTYLIAKKNVDFLYDPCYDTFPKKSEPKMTIKVDPVKSMDSTSIPNVFTPGNNSAYPFWRFENDVSITDLEIAIYNRYGKKVYYFIGNIRDWEGWDGTNDGNGKIVTTGVYYYVVKKISPLPDFETKKLPDKLSLAKKGFIHVYSGK